LTDNPFRLLELRHHPQKTKKRIEEAKTLKIQQKREYQGILPKKRDWLN